MTSEKPKPALAKTAGLISAATMLSRLLGLIREALLATLIGAGALTDAFTVAFRIPNLLRDLFAEGALAQAFVPTFKADIHKHGKASAFELGSLVMGTLMVLVGAIVIIAVICAPQIVNLWASGFHDAQPGKVDLTITLTRIMMPFLLIVSLSAVSMGMLNAQDKYTAPALAPAMFNLASITVGFSLYIGAVEGPTVVICWSVGTLLGGLLQLGVQLPALWRSGFRPKLRVDLALRDPRMRRIGTLMLPAIAGLAAVQVNIVINTYFASSEEGAVSWLNYAFRFLQLPIGVFGVAIATVSTTRYAAAAAKENLDIISLHLVEGLRLVVLLTVPSTVGLIVLGEPIIRLVYEHGEFGSASTAATSSALRYYAIGLVAYSAVKVLAPAFYALNKAHIALKASLCAVVGNLAINVGLHGSYGYRVLAFGTALAAILNFGVLYATFHLRVAAVPHRKLLAHCLRVIVASAFMAAVVWGTWQGLRGLLIIDHKPSLFARILVVIIPVTIGAVSYAAACVVLQISEIKHYYKKIAQRN